MKRKNHQHGTEWKRKREQEKKSERRLEREREREQKKYRQQHFVDGKSHDSFVIVFCFSLALLFMLLFLFHHRENAQHFMLLFFESKIRNKNINMRETIGKMFFFLSFNLGRMEREGKMAHEGDEWPRLRASLWVKNLSNFIQMSNFRFASHSESPMSLREFYDNRLIELKWQQQKVVVRIINLNAKMLRVRHSLKKPVLAFSSSQHNRLLHSVLCGGSRQPLNSVLNRRAITFFFACHIFGVCLNVCLRSMIVSLLSLS